MTRSIVPFLSTADAGPEAGALDRAGAGDDLDGGGEVARIGRRHERGGVGRSQALDHADFHAAFRDAAQVRRRP